MNKTNYLTILALVTCVYVANAQGKLQADDVMYKKEVIRAIDLREPQNSPFFSKNREITSFLIKAVSEGKLTPYSNDSLTSKITLEEFTKRLIIPGSEPTDYNESLAVSDEESESEMPKGPDLFFARDLYQMELKEDVYFDKNKSQMKYNIKALTFYVPADHPANIRGIQTIVASFDYKQLVKVFKDNPNAIGFNAQNDTQHKNLTDAFDLRLFSSYLIKVSNPQDRYISDLYSDQSKGIMASQWAAQELLEFEHNLWEF